MVQEDGRVSPCTIERPELQARESPRIHSLKGSHKKMDFVALPYNLGGAHLVSERGILNSKTQVQALHIAQRPQFS